MTSIRKNIKLIGTVRVGILIEGQPTIIRIGIMMDRLNGRMG